MRDDELKKTWKILTSLLRMSTFNSRYLQYNIVLLEKNGSQNKQRKEKSDIGIKTSIEFIFTIIAACRIHGFIGSSQTAITSLQSCQAIKYPDTKSRALNRFVSWCRS